MRIIIIGGGVIGTSTAYFLGRHGHEVVVVDRADRLAGEASFANGGMLHASNSEPWNTPEVVSQLLRWIGREDSPLLLRPGQIPNLMGWGLNFLRYSRAHHHRRNTRANARLAVYSLHQTQALRAATGIGYDHGTRGIVKIFRDKAELDHAEAASGLTEDLGIRHERLDRDALIALEPALQDVGDSLVGGMYYPDDEHGDACLFSQQLGEYCEREFATVFRLGETVDRLEQAHGRVSGVVTDRGRIEGDVYVLAAGAQAGLLARPLGVRLPIRPVKGYSATLAIGDRAGAPSVPIIDHGRKVVITTLGQRLRVAGTAEFAGFDQQVHPERVRQVIDQALMSFPRLAASLDPEPESQWACLRPLTVDGPPILGASGIDNLYLNCGAGHMGWTFAAGAGRVVADMVQGVATEISMEGLTLSRYGR